MPAWDEAKTQMETEARRLQYEKHTNVGKNNRLGEILELMSANQGWTTIKLIAEHFNWTDQEAANKMGYYARTGYVQVSDHVRASAVGRPLSIYTITDLGLKILSNYALRVGGTP
jgi:predicted ArsR family transcriptional regulator